jgi:hypothetical protein
MSKEYLARTLLVIEEWHQSLFTKDSDGDSYLTDYKTERKVRKIRDQLRAML